MIKSLTVGLQRTVKAVSGYPRGLSSTFTKGLLSPVHSTASGHKRNLLIVRRRPLLWFAVSSLGVFVLWILFLHTGRGQEGNGIEIPDQTGGPPEISLGRSIDWRGREVFWWEQFHTWIGFYRGWQNIVPYSGYIPEQKDGLRPLPEHHKVDRKSLDPYKNSWNPRKPCLHSYTPQLSAYKGVPQGMPMPLFGSHEELGFDTDVCYDRVNRYAPYGLGYSESEGGLGIHLDGDNVGIEEVFKPDYRGVRWGEAQHKCVESNANQTLPRTAFVIRAWHDLKWTPQRIVMVRAIISELSLASGGQYEVVFLIDVHDDTIPIWASDEAYNETLKNALPEEFQGMGILWSVPQMRLIYPPPFDEYINFSGGGIWGAYRSLHFPMQYFASKHPEYDYFWHWEMDLRVTGHYYELLDRVTKWAERQPKDYLWERNSRFFIPSRHGNSYAQFNESVVQEWKTLNKPPISGPQVPAESLFPIPAERTFDTNDESEPIETVDLIAINPIFDPVHSRWAFRDDVTGYHANATYSPPKRAALITATRYSRRLLQIMHVETFRNKHTMFPEMYAASTALHYGLKAVYAPMPVYLNSDWPAEHADELFNNAPQSKENIANKIGYAPGTGYWHGKGGSVFGPAEHVFRGSTYYSNAAFAGYLWRRWLGGEGGKEWELGEGGGRMCLPMMVLHPIKNE